MFCINANPCYPVCYQLIRRSSHNIELYLIAVNLNKIFHQSLCLSLIGNLTKNIEPLIYSTPTLTTSQVYNRLTLPIITCCLVSSEVNIVINLT